MMNVPHSSVPFNDKKQFESVISDGYDVIVLYDGYSSMNTDGTEMRANCTCTLLKGLHNIIVDTMTAWDKDRILAGLEQNHLKPDDIDFVICSHGHSDHIGNNNLFLKAKHIVGFSISHGNIYFIHPFDTGVPYTIDKYVNVIPTPGHTLSDITVKVVSKNNNVYAVAGDLFECAEDINNPSLWQEAGSESPYLQRRHRSAIADSSDWIIPGHGKPFQSSPEIKKSLRSQMHIIDEAYPNIEKECAKF